MTDTPVEIPCPAPTAGQNLLLEGVRLFFPVAAIHAIIWPLLWVVLLGFDLPFARATPTGQWHAHEMIFGTFGAALAGFLTSAVAEWTDTRPTAGRNLLILCGLWAPGRVVGMLGADNLIGLAAVTDLAFFALLGWFVIAPMIEKRSARHASFVIWLLALGSLQAGVRLAWMAGDFELSARLLHLAILVFIALFALALSRINIVVFNLAIDPSGETTPYRPHPGRQNLAAAATGLYALAELLFPESQAPAFLALAAGCAFMDRLAEWFIGRAVLQGHLLAVGAANLFAGLGLIAIGVAGLGGPVAPATGLHILSVGALGLAIISVFIIAGLRHTGRDLTVLPWQAHVAIVLIIAACLVRALPELGLLSGLLGRHYALASIFWAGAFGVWLTGFLPFLSQSGVTAESRET